MKEYEETCGDDVQEKQKRSVLSNVTYTYILLTPLSMIFYLSCYLCRTATLPGSDIIFHVRVRLPARVIHGGFRKKGDGNLGRGERGRLRMRHNIASFPHVSPRGGVAARWCSGAVAQWRSSALARWHGSAAAQWRRGAAAPARLRDSTAAQRCCRAVFVRARGGDGWGRKR